MTSLLEFVFVVCNFDVSDRALGSVAADVKSALDSFNSITLKSFLDSMQTKLWSQTREEKTRAGGEGLLTSSSSVFQ